MLGTFNPYRGHEMEMNDIGPLVRLAVPADLEHIIRIAERLHEENGHSKIHYPTAVAALHEAVHRQRAVIGIIGPVGDIRGIVFLRFAAWWYAGPSDVFLEELFLYVPPEYRKGTGHAAALLRFAKSTAKSLGVPLVIGVLSSKKTKAKLRLYEKHLGQPVGGYFFVQP